MITIERSCRIVPIRNPIPNGNYRHLPPFIFKWVESLINLQNDDWSAIGDVSMKWTKNKKGDKPDRVNVRRGMRTYTIPVDSDGYVPKWALVQRYQEVGNRKDRGHSASLILPSKVTPDQIVDWWADPSVCDVEGIDDENPEIYSVPFSIRGRKREALKNIAVLAPKKEAHRIKKVLADSFTAEELEIMSADRSMMISTEEHLDDCTGYYLRRQNGVEVPQIVLEDGTTPDGIVHEAVHHLRVVDGRTSFPTTDKVLDTSYARYPKSRKDEIVRREEAETVAETVARTRIDPVQSGYYDSVPGRSSRSAYLRDQEIISDGKSLKGKAAIKAAEDNFDRTSISRAIISSNRKGRR